jgi:Na+/H+ antiporter NhaD/arsenite permease-like protein
VLADLFMLSRMPAVMAERLLDRMGTARGAMLAMALLAGFISCAVENVAVVMLVAPVCLSLAERLKLSPVRLLLFVTMFSNLQGTSTLIGDPPSMLLGGHLRLSFLDFFWYRSRPGIFFAVQAGALAAALVVAWFLRQHSQKVHLDLRTTARSWFPSALMLALAAGLSVASAVDPAFVWFAGALAVGLATVGLAWYQWVARWGSTRKLVRELDWDTAFFLVGVFLIVGGLVATGCPARTAEWISGAVGGNLAKAYVVIVLVSVAVSAFVDNVPYVAVMLPVTAHVTASLHAETPILAFGLLLGACLGGNITPVGATANVVTLGVLRKAGHTVRFREFVGLGSVFTIAAVAAGAVFLWLFWA